MYLVLTIIAFFFLYFHAATAIVYVHINGVAFTTIVVQKGLLLFALDFVLFYYLLHYITQVIKSKIKLGTKKMSS